ncbi:hypothetical protein D305_gp47 [Pseudomonas phage UFV-P2]|uniref:Uncharacterized protein n=1 Tax=Pseudomonas phage UFV-P2 TaxID=1235661 RepID=M4TI36_9CAUD|nr:hypothetical protein D305_gp47 [Pseudomonas phage UFV-P2]AGH62728.1 hypothetical protein [Pseudomonas phage UFV-P2]
MSKRKTRKSNIRSIVVSEKRSPSPSTGKKLSPNSNLYQEAREDYPISSENRHWLDAHVAMKVIARDGVPSGKGCLLEMIRRVCDQEPVPRHECPCITCDEWRKERAEGIGK